VRANDGSSRAGNSSVGMSVEERMKLEFGG
jgi:hypothetical protein